jgi:hypothetical protein
MNPEGPSSYPIDDGRPARTPDDLRTDPHAERNPEAIRGIAILTQLAEVAKASRAGEVRAAERDAVLQRQRHSLAAISIILDGDSPMMREVVFAHYGLHSDEGPAPIAEIAETTGEDIGYIGALVDHGATLVGQRFHE